MSPSCSLRAFGLRTVDIDVGFAQHARGGKQCQRILAQAEAITGIHLHQDFNRSELLGLIRHHSDVGHVADVNAGKAHRRAHAQAAGVIEIGFQKDFGSEQSAGAAHQENQNAQRDAGSQHCEPDFEFRPLELLLARHAFSRANSFYATLARTTWIFRIIADKKVSSCHFGLWT